MLSALKTYGAGCTVFFQQVVCRCLCEFKVGADGRDRCPVRFLFSSDESLMSYVSTVYRHQHRMQQHYQSFKWNKELLNSLWQKVFSFQSRQGKSFSLLPSFKKKKSICIWLPNTVEIIAWWKSQNMLLHLSSAVRLFPRKSSDLLRLDYVKLSWNTSKQKLIWDGDVRNLYIYNNL